MAGPFYYDSAVGGGTGDGLSWANARTSLATMTSVLAGDLIYVAHTHAEAPGSALTINFPGTAANPNQVLCVNKAGSVPPTSADWRTTASVATTGTFNISLVGSAYIQGITFNAGIGSAAVVSISINQATGGTVGGWQHLENCMLRISSTSATNTSRVVIGQSGSNVGNRCILTNTGFYFTNANNNIQFACGQIEWRNTANPFPNVAPTTMVVAYGTPCNVVFEGIDFYTPMLGKTFFAAAPTHFRASLYGCNIPASTATATIAHPSVEIHYSGSGFSLAPPSQSYESRYNQEGLENTVANIARVGGASDGSIPHSRAYQSTLNAQWWKPYVGNPFVKWNDVAGADLTLTIYGIWYNNSMPTNGGIHFEAHYFADTFAANRSPLMAIAHNGRTNFQATSTPWTADTSDWTAGSVPARFNNNAYPQNAVFKVASNPGRLFWKSNSGTSTSAASEPAAYATAVDGDTITDGTCTIIVGMRFKMTLTLSSPQPQLAGPIYVYPKIGSSLRLLADYVWLDPIIG
jgi:hypothetical protein